MAFLAWENNLSSSKPMLLNHPWLMACCWTRRKKIVQLMLIGLDGAGKTSLVRYLLKDPSNILVPTMGYSSFDLRKFRSLMVKVIDVGGGKTIRDIWKNYFSFVHGFIFVIDSSDVNRIELVKNLLRETLSNEKVRGKPLLVLVNKQDIETALDEFEVSKKIDLNLVVNLYECPTKVESCSLLNRWGNRVNKNPLINRGFFWLLEFIANNWQQLNERVEQDTELQLIYEQQVMAEKIKRLRGNKKITGVNHSSGILDTQSESMRVNATMENSDLGDEDGEPEVTSIGNKVNECVKSANTDKPVDLMRGNRYFYQRSKSAALRSNRVAPARLNSH